MQFFGREKETEALGSALKALETRGLSRLVAVTGRPRTGKTALITQALKRAQIPVFAFCAQDKRPSETARQWQQAVASVFEPEFVPEINCPAGVIAWTMTLSESRPCVFVIDDCGRFAKETPHFYKELRSVWEKRKSSARMLLILSGTDTPALRSVFDGSGAPLADCVDSRIEVRPFTPAELCRIMAAEIPSFAPLDLLAVYAVTGGAAAYVEHLASHQALTADALLPFVLSGKGAWLREEGDKRLAAGCQRKNVVYKRLLSIAAAGPVTWTDLQAVTEERVTSYLKRLEDFGCLKRIFPAGEAPSPRGTRYRIADPFLRFWMTFVYPAEIADAVNFGRRQEAGRLAGAMWPAFLRRALTDWFCESLRKGGAWSQVGLCGSADDGRGFELIAINEATRRILFGRVCLSSDEYREPDLRKDVENWLRRHPKYAGYAVEMRDLFPASMQSVF